MKFRAVLFDLDGTLLDSIDDLADSVNSVMARFGFPVHEVAAYRYFVGDGVEALARRALPQDCRDEATVASCVAAMREEYSKRWSCKTHPYEGVPGLLSALAAADIRMAVLSNKPDDFAKKVVAELLPHWRFDIVDGVSASVPTKPDPAGAIRIAEVLKIAPREFLYLGDTDTDMKTAVAAGMYPVGALWGFRTARELMANGARALVMRPTDVLGSFR